MLSHSPKVLPPATSILGNTNIQCKLGPFWRRAAGGQTSIDRIRGAHESSEPPLPRRNDAMNAAYSIVSRLSRLSNDEADDADENERPARRPWLPLVLVLSAILVGAAALLAAVKLGGAVNGPQHLPHLHKRRDPNASSMQGGIFGGGDDFAW